MRSFSPVEEMQSSSSFQSRMISVVIPLYNEGEKGGTLVAKVTAALEKLPMDYELILVNDGSKDSTGFHISEEARKNPRVKGIHFRRNYGQTTALVAGFHHAKGDPIITLDGDLQNDPD